MWSKIWAKIKSFLAKRIVRIIAIVIIIIAIIAGVWLLFGNQFFGYKIVSVKKNTIYVYLPKDKVNQKTVATVVKKAQSITKSENKKWLKKYKANQDKSQAATSGATPNPPLTMLRVYDDKTVINELISPVKIAQPDLSKLTADARRATQVAQTQEAKKVGENRLAHLVFQANSRNNWQISYGINYQKLP